jgi:hypothetical protein
MKVVQVSKMTANKKVYTKDSMNLKKKKTLQDALVSKVKMKAKKVWTVVLVSALKTTWRAVLDLKRKIQSSKRDNILEMKTLKGVLPIQMLNAVVLSA